eukprot:gene13318-biopygen9969
MHMNIYRRGCAMTAAAAAVPPLCRRPRYCNCRAPALIAQQETLLAFRDVVPKLPHVPPMFPRVSPRRPIPNYADPECVPNVNGGGPNVPECADTSFATPPNVCRIKNPRLRMYPTLRALAAAAAASLLRCSHLRRRHIPA